MKKGFIFGIVFFIMIASVFGNIKSVVNTGWRLDQNNTMIYNDYAISDCGTNVYSPSINNYGLDNDNSDEGIYRANADIADDLFTDQADFSFSVWIKPDADTPTNNGYIVQNYAWVSFIQNTAGNLLFSLNNGAGDISATLSADSSQWHMYTATFDYIDSTHGNWCLIEDNYNRVNCHNDTSDATGNIHVNRAVAIGTFSRVGATCVTALSFEGLLDEVYFYDEVINKSTIANLYNSGTGFFYPFVVGGGAGVDPSVTLKTNVIDGDNIGFLDFSDGVYKFNVNGSSINNSNIYDVKIYINGTLNKTYSALNLSNNIELNWTDFVNIEAMINLTIEATNENASDKLSYDIYFDGIYPEISQAGLTNNTIYYKNHDPDFYINMTSADNNLFAINYTLTKGNDIISTLFNTSITGSPQIDQFLINISSLTTGSYLYNVRAWDSHTAKIIKDYLIQETIFDNKKAYQIENGIYIFGSDINKIDFYKQTDRYIFEVDFKKENPEIEIFADDLIYIENSPYEAHFVSIRYNKWVDFVIDGTSVSYNIIQIGPGHYKITFITPEKKLKFKSIGDLNVFEATYLFNISDSMSFFAVDSITNNTINTFSILVDGQIYSTTTGQAYVNLTSGTYETNITSSLYVTNSTNVSYSAGGSFTFHLTADKSLYLFIYDEQTNELIDDRNITLEVINFENISSTYTTSTGSKFISGFAPGNYEIRYLTNGYNPRTFYTTIASQTTQTIRLYMLNSSVASYVAFSIEDETGNSLEGAVVSATRFYTDCNCYRVVEMDKANFQGQAIFSLEKYDTRYNFIISYGGAVVYSSTAGYKLTSDIYTLPVSLLGDTTQSYFGINQDIFTQLTYNNATKLITFSVVDSTNLVDHFCIYVDQMNSLSDAGYLRICENCLTAYTGSVNCNISAYYDDGREIISRGFIETNTNYSSYWTDVLNVVTDTSGKAVTGKVGVFLTLLISLTLSMIGFSIGGPQMAIMGLDLGIIVSKMVGIFYIGIAGLFAIVGVSIIIIYLIGERS